MPQVPNPNIVMGIKPFTPPDLAALRQAGDERIQQNKLNESNLKTAGINQQVAETNLAQSQQDLQTGVLRSLAMDTLGVRKLLDSSEVAPELRQQAGALLANMAMRTERIGGSPDLMNRVAMLAATDPKAAVEFLDKNIIPVIEAQNPDLFTGEILSDSDVTEQGQVVSKDWKGVITARDVAGFTKESEDLTILDQIMPDGSIRSVQADGKGGFYDMQGKKQTIPADARLVRSTLSGSQDDLGLNQAEMRGLRDTEVAARTFISTAADAIELLETTPDINTFVASAAGLVNNVQQEAKAIGRALGFEVNTSMLDPSEHEGTFDHLGIQNQEVKSLITSLAYQAAAASGQSGRDISNRDIVRFIEEIGASSSDPRAFQQSIRDVAERTDRAFRINYETRVREPFDGDLGLGTLAPGGQDDLSGLSDEEFLQLLNSPVAQ